MISGEPRIEFPDSLKTWQVCLLESKEADTEWQSFWSENDVALSLMITVATNLITADDNCCHIPHCDNDNWCPLRGERVGGWIELVTFVHHSRRNIKLYINKMQAVEFTGPKQAGKRFDLSYHLSCWRMATLSYPYQQAVIAHGKMNTPQLSLLTSCPPSRERFH